MVCMSMAKTDKKLKLKEEKEIIPKLYFAVRIRGAPGMRKTILDTLKMLRMHRVNHGVLVWGVKSFMGMLDKCKDYIAFGEINENSLLKLLTIRGKIEGNKPLTDEHVKNLTKYKNIPELAQALLKGEIQYREKDIYKIKPVFRLHPPKGGHRGTIKKHFNEKGTLGYVKDYINEIIKKMV